MSSYWLDAIIQNVKVEQADGYVLFSGFRAKPFLCELQRVFKTTRFQTGMVSAVTGFSFRVRLFFAYDFYRLLKIMEENPTPYYRKDVVGKLVLEMEKTPLIGRTLVEYPSRLDRKELKRMGFAPLPNQEEFFKVYDQKTQQYGLKGYILASPPGTGKTYMSLALQAMLKKEVVLVFSPSNALDQVWKDTLKTKMTGTDAYVYPANMEFGKTHYVFSHDNLKFALPFIKKICHGKKVGIIVDECHNFNELTSDRTQMLIEICRMSGSQDILFMSGTPFKALGREVIPFLLATDPSFGKKEEDGFKKIFGASGNSAIGVLSSRIGRMMHKVDKAEVVKNKVTVFDVKVSVPGSARFTLPEIKRCMEAFVRERVAYYAEHMEDYVKQYQDILKRFEATLYTKRDHEDFKEYLVLVDKIRHTKDLREVREETKASNLYERKVIIPALSSKDKELFREAKSVYKYVTLKIQGEALGRVLGQERVVCNQAIVEHIDNGKVYCTELDMNGDDWDALDIFRMSQSKVVMFTDYVQVLKTTEQMLRKHKLKPALVYGETNKDLNDILYKVEKDPDLNPIVATYKSLSTAVPLISCDTVVLLNTPYRDHVYQQTVSRVDRLGQKHPVKIFRYELDTGEVPNISTRSKEIMEWSKAMVDKLLGIESDGVDEEALEDEIESSFDKVPKTPRGLTVFDW